MPTDDQSQDLSRKLNVLIALALLQLREQVLSKENKKGTGELAIFLKSYGLSYEDIATILNSPIASVRELVSRNKRGKDASKGKRRRK